VPSRIDIRREVRRFHDFRDRVDRPLPRRCAPETYPRFAGHSLWGWATHLPRPYSDVVSILHPTALADAARRSHSRRGWGNTIIGIGVAALIFAAFSGWPIALIVTGVVGVIAGFLTTVSAEGHIRNVIAEEAAYAAIGFDVTFDQSWLPEIHRIYRQARDEAIRSTKPLDETFKGIFVDYLVSRGHRRQY
jgi:hypothetical protein